MKSNWFDNGLQKAIVLILTTAFALLSAGFVRDILR